MPEKVWDQDTKAICVFKDIGCMMQLNKFSLLKNQKSFSKSQVLKR
jgi:hypothetical protein